MILKKGSNGEEVKILQKFLGVLDDGDFGQMTENAVKSWQKRNGLLDDGIVGPITIAKMGLKLIKEDVVIQPVGGLDINKLNGHIPTNVLQQIPDVVQKFQINTPLRLSHFLSQCAHESGGFRLTVENLNYTTDGLMKTFGIYFPSRSLAEQYARQPERIASRVYGSRMGNGAENTKEGWRFRGRGYIQLTGKENYRLFDNFVDENIMENPDLVATKYPLLSAAWFFNRNCMTRADRGATDEVVRSVTRCVNGGFNGIEDRIKHFKEYYRLLTQ